MVQLYGVRSKRNWGIGDFGDLRALVEFAAARGAAVVGVNPLHATQGSPYSPSSRLALNFLYLDVEALPEYAQSAAAQRLVKTKAFQRKLEQLRKAPLVDYAGVAVLKLNVLGLIFKDAKPRVERPSTFAIFEALREKYGGGWETWPREYREPGSRYSRGQLSQPPPYFSRSASKMAKVLGLSTRGFASLKIRPSTLSLSTATPA